MKTKLALLILILANLACGVQIVGDAAHSSPAPHNPSANSAPVPPGWSEYVVTGDVNIRTCADASCPSIGLLVKGEKIQAKCDKQWCQIQKGYIWSACLGIGSGKCSGK